MFQRQIHPDLAKQIIVEGEVIADYPEDLPFPNVLLLGFIDSQPVHAVVAQELTDGDCHLVTIYLPDPEILDETFKRRRAR